MRVGRDEKPPLFYTFHTLSANVGKSHLIKLINEFSIVGRFNLIIVESANIVMTFLSLALCEISTKPKIVSRQHFREFVE